MRIAITAPTGNIGRKLVARLLDEKKHELVLLARDPSTLTSEGARGAEVLPCDLHDAQAVRSGTRGAQALFWLNPPHAQADDFVGYARALAGNAADAIRASEIPHTVFLSSIGAHLGPGFGPISALHECEKVLREAAPGLTVLRPTFFMENFMMSLGSIAEAGAIFMPVPADARIPMVATADIADVAAGVLTSSPPAGVRVVPIHGPRDYSFAEAAAAIGAGLGREVAFVQVSPEQTLEGLRGFGVSDHVAGLYVEMYDSIASGRLEAEYPRSPESTTPTRLEDVAREVFAPAMEAQAPAGS